MSSTSTPRIASGELFPSDEPLPAGQLIGREADVVAIAAALKAGTNLVIAEPRRTGKTTVCDAALHRLGKQGLYTVAIDLWEIADLSELAEALVTKTVANRPKLKRLVHDLRSRGRDAASNVQLRTLMTLTGELGEDIQIAFEPGLASRDPQRYLDFALRLPERIAAKDGKRAVLFLDEFQNIRSLEDSGRANDPEALQKRMRTIFQRSTHVSFLFAGSIEHLMRDIFAPTERPFSQFGGFHDLQPITDDDWREGITERLSRDGCTIAERALNRLIELGELHPRATMLIAQQAHLAAVQEGTRELGSDLVEFGYALALRLDRVKHQQTIDRIRHLSSGKTVNKHALRMARRVARGEKLYAGIQPEVVRRTLRALQDAGIIEAQEDERGWRIVDPLFRRYLADMDPAGV